MKDLKEINLSEPGGRKEINIINLKKKFIRCFYVRSAHFITLFMQNTAVNLYLDSHQCEKNSADKIAIV